MKYGLDIGGTKIEIAIFDDQIVRQHAWRVATPKDDYSVFIKAIAAMVSEADNICGSKGSVGIALPGFFDIDDSAVSSNIPCINGKKLKVDISAALDRPVEFENDVKAFALSEANGGAGGSSRHVLGIVLGTGFAGGLCINGELYYGRQNIAGEYGHVELPTVLKERYGFPLRECGCRDFGCVETYLAGPGLLWMCEHFESEYKSIQSLVSAMRNNEEKANQIMAAYIDCLGCFFAELTLMFDPDIIVLGGGISNIVEIIERTPDVVNQYLFEAASPPKIVAAQFGDSSGVRGAAILGSRVARTSLSV